MRFSDSEIGKYVLEQGCELLRAQWPEGIVNALQFRDLVRTYVGGCFVMDQCKHPELTQLVEHAAHPEWFPDQEWYYWTAGN